VGLRTVMGPKRIAFAALVLTVAVSAVGCRMAPPPGTSHSPSGKLDEVRVQGDASNSGNVGWYVRGWAIDWDTTEPVDVVIVAYQSGHEPWWPLTYPGWPVPASLPRGDVEAAFHRGVYHGFETSFVNPPSGWNPLAPATICAVALNVGPGENTVLGCKTVTVAP
jgi:hypothetical protein